MIHQKIQRLFAHFKAHQRPVAVVLALTGKAVAAVQIAGVRHVQTQRLDHIAAALLEGARQSRKGVRAEQRALADELRHVVNARPQLLLRHVRPIRIFFPQRIDDLVRGMIRIQRDHVVGHLVHRVNRAGAGIQHDIVAIQLILMNHGKPSLCF